VSGTIFTVDPGGPAGSVVDSGLLTQAKIDLTEAFDDAAGRVPVPAGSFLNPGDANIGGLTLVPGLYKFTTTALLTGADVTLAGGPDDVWIFQIGTDLIVGSGIKVILEGGARAGNIFWQVGSSATIGTFAEFKGSILANVVNVATVRGTPVYANGDSIASLEDVTTADDADTRVDALPLVPPFITKSASLNPALPGQLLVFTISVSNASVDGVVSNVTVGESYDPLFNYKYSTPSPRAGTSNVWDLGDMPPGFIYDKITWALTCTARGAPTATGAR
jgi:hypothetical protein